jgi:hypothetical protein
MEQLFEVWQLSFEPLDTAARLLAVGYNLQRYGSLGRRGNPLM